MSTQIKVMGPRGAGLGVGDSARSARARALQDYASRFERAAGGRKAALREGKGRFTFQVLRGGKPVRANPPVGSGPVAVDAHSRKWPKGHQPKGPKPVDIARASIERSIAAGHDRMTAEATALAAVRAGSTATDKGVKIVVTRVLNQVPAYAIQTPLELAVAKVTKAAQKKTAPKKKPKAKPAPMPGELTMAQPVPTLTDPAALQAGKKVLVLGLDDVGRILVAEAVKNKTAAKSVATELMPGSVRYRLVLEIHSSYRVR